MRVFVGLWSRVRVLWEYRHEPEYLRVLANTFWQVLLSVVTFIIVCAALYGGLKLYALLWPRESGIVLQRGGAGVVLNRGELQAALDGFAGKKEQYEVLKTHRPQIADPSI